jgi:hypothetical protein
LERLRVPAARLASKIVLYGASQAGDTVRGAKLLATFTKAEGAGLHCQPMARSLLEQRMYDWLDEILAR